MRPAYTILAGNSLPPSFVAAALGEGAVVSSGLAEAVWAGGAGALVVEGGGAAWVGPGDS